MPAELFTPRLRLVALSADQLKQCLHSVTTLEADLRLPVSRQIIDANVTRAINLKLVKMAMADAPLHGWFTYWLIDIKAVPFGAGFVGLKGLPDKDGKTEVGYGIDAAYRNQGYMTEALQALSGWAFSHPGCLVLTATSVSNPASEKVLQKAGWRLMRQGNNSSDWELHRQKA